MSATAPCDVDASDVAGDLLRAAQQCLAEADPLRKVALTQAHAAAFRAGRLKLPLGTAKAWIRRSLSALRECMA